MFITEILGNLDSIDIKARSIDRVWIEWWDARKKIARLTSEKGKDVAIKLQNSPKEGMSDGDILYADSKEIVCISIHPVRTLCVSMQTISDIARVCYEIGNRHAPLFFSPKSDQNTQFLLTLCTPYELPIERLFQKMNVFYEERQEVLDAKMRFQVSMIHSEPTAKIKVDENFKVRILENK